MTGRVLRLFGPSAERQGAASAFDEDLRELTAKAERRKNARCADCAYFRTSTGLGVTLSTCRHDPPTPDG